MKALGFAGLALLVATAAHADPRDEALSAMLRCSGTTDKAQRLACYDAAVVRVPGALNPPQPVSMPQASAVPAPAAAAAPAPVRRVRKGFLSGIFGSTPSRAPQTTVAQFGIELGNRQRTHALQPRRLRCGRLRDRRQRRQQDGKEQGERADGSWHRSGIGYREGEGWPVCRSRLNRY